MDYLYHQIIFEGISGTDGTVALDDIEYHVGVDCNGQKKDSQGESTTQIGWIYQYLSADCRSHLLNFCFYFLLIALFKGIKGIFQYTSLVLLTVHSDITFLFLFH